MPRMRHSSSLTSRTPIEPSWRLEVQPFIDNEAARLPPEILFSLGVTLLSCLLTYLVCRTSVPGAELLKGYTSGCSWRALLAPQRKRRRA
jgi:hypothetical protein